MPNTKNKNPGDMEMSGKNGLSIDLQSKLLGAILEFMIRSGLSEAAIRASFSSSLENLGSKVESVGNPTAGDCRYVGNGNVSAELLRLWTRDSRYLTRDAKPRPLSLLKGKSSLVSLISRLDASVDPKATVESMRAVGLLKTLPNGKLLPTAESVKIDHLHPLAIEHVAKSLIRLVATVCRNTDPTREAVPLIERYAYVPDLSAAETEAFADFTRTQGMAYLESVDDWLEKRRSRRQKSSGKETSQVGITAGVHLVAYLGDGFFPSQVHLRKRSMIRVRAAKKSATPPREARV